MNILNHSPHQSPFSNQIDTLRADNNYYERLIEENNKLIQQLTSAQDMVKQFLALGEEAIELLKKIDQRFVEVVKESALRLFGEDNSDSRFSSDLLPSYVKSPNGYGVGFTFEYQNNSDTIEEFSPSPNSVTSFQLPVTSEEKTTDNGEDDFQDPEDNNNGGNSPLKPDPQPDDGDSSVTNEPEKTGHWSLVTGHCKDGGCAVKPENNLTQSTTADESTNSELIDQPKVESNSNDYIDWVKTSNPNVAYFKTKHDGSIRCYIGLNNKTQLKSWATNLQNLISGLGTEVRDGCSLNYKHELKLYNLTEQDCQWLVSLDFDKKPSECLIPESTRMTETKIEINEEEVPTGCLLERSKDWAVLEYYVYVYSRQFNPKERCFEIDSKRIGRLVQYDKFISAWRNRAAVSGDFTNTSDAIDYLLKTSSLSREDIAKAYYKKFPEEEQTPYGTCECGQAFDIPGVDANHCPECGWIGRSDSEQPEQQQQLAATTPDPFGGFNF